MELWGDVLCPRVEDEGNISGMFFGEPNKDTLTSLGVPFGNCFAILKFGVKNVDRASKNMGTREM
jgi:hypothetical protein